MVVGGCVYALNLVCGTSHPSHSTRHLLTELFKQKKNGLNSLDAESKGEEVARIDLSLLSSCGG